MINSKIMLSKNNWTIFKFLNLFCFLFVWSVIPAKAQDSYWTPDVGLYDNYMTITGYFLLNGEELQSDQIEIGCFIEGTCRGTYQLQGMPYLGHSYPGFLSIWGSSSDNGKEITVKIYNHETKEVYEAKEKPPFQYNESIGIDSPYQFSISVAVKHGISISSSVNGSVTANVSSSDPGEMVTLTIVPDTNYELDAMLVYRTGDVATTISVSGTENTRTFTMPDYSVTILPTFKKTVDLQAVETAKDIINASPFVATQRSSNLPQTVINWLVDQINNRIRLTNVTVSASDITLDQFNAASSGTTENFSGLNGSFTFTVILKKGSVSQTSSLISGTIVATQVYSIHILNAVNGKVSSSQTIAAESESITLTCLPDTNYEIDAVSVYKTGDEATTVFVDGTDNNRTFIMPDYEVSVSVTFKKVDDLLNVETATALINAASFNVEQSRANSQQDVLDWLVIQINSLIETTSVTISVSNITLSNFKAAIAGTEGNSSGTNGSFRFVVNLNKGSVSQTSSNMNGIIHATSTYLIRLESSTNGRIASDKTLVHEGESVTLTFTPEQGYQLNEVSVSQTGAVISNIPLDGQDNNRTFTMPGYNVTVNGSFCKASDLQAIEAARTFLSEASFSVPQSLVNTHEATIAWLVDQINDLISSTSIRITPSEIVLDRFSPALAGSNGNLTGIDGSFGFTVTLKLGTVTRTSGSMAGVITATEVYPISIEIPINGNVSTDKKFAASGEIVTLTINPISNNVLDSMLVFKTNDGFVHVVLSGTGNIRTFVMPNYSVSVKAIFKESSEWQKVKTASEIMDSTSFIVTQSWANTQQNVILWLVNYINLKIRSTGVTVTASDISIEHFTAAISGSGKNYAGSDGRFDFTVLIKGGDMTQTSGLLHGEIRANYTYPINIGTYINGRIDASSIYVAAGGMVTLFLSPDSDYQIDEVLVYKADDEATTVVLSGDNTTRTFYMPGFGVTVMATFKINDDIQLLKDAKAFIDSALFDIFQKDGNTKESVQNWLVDSINSLIRSTGITISESDIILSDFVSAIKGNADNLSGTNGRFNFSVELKKNDATLAVDRISESIIATEVYPVHIETDLNGTVSADPIVAAEGDTVSLMFFPNVNYVLDTVIAHQFGNDAVLVAIDGASNDRTFIMPNFKVALVASFKEHDDLFALETAKALIVSYTFDFAQSIANTEEDVINKLVEQINTLIISTGVRITASDIVVGLFNQAITGTVGSYSGVNGAFRFTLDLKKGNHNLSLENLGGVIHATEYILENMNINMTDNGIIHLSNIGNVTIDQLVLTLTGDHAQDFTLSTISLDYLGGNSDTIITLVPSVNLASGDYLLTLTVNANNMEPVVNTFNYVVIENSVLANLSNPIKVWSSNSLLNIQAPTDGEAFIYSMGGQFVKRVRYHQIETTQVQLKQGVYIVITKQQQFKVLVF